MVKASTWYESAIRLRRKLLTLGKPQLYLHIGHPKSGSTTLQSFLYKNWILLSDSGFAMPTSQLKLATETTPPGNPIAYLQSCRHTGDVTAIEDWIFAAAKNFNKLLLSAECFSEWFWHKPFIELSQEVDVHLLYYVRRQDEILLSAWRQWGLKRGMSLDAFIDHRIEEKHPEYLNILWPWLNKVSVKSFHVKFISTHFLNGKSLLEDAADLLGVNINQMQPVENQNISVDARLLQFMSERPQYFSSIHDDKILQLFASAPIAQKPLRLSLTEEQFSRIHETFESTNQALLQKFQPDHAGTPVLARETAPVETQQPWRDEQIQQDFVLKCLQALEKHDDNRVKELREELEEEQNC